MGALKQAVYGLYRRVQRFAPAATAAYFLHDLAARNEAKRCAYRPGAPVPGPSERRPIPARAKETVIAFVCDEMTRRDFEGECRALFLTPQNWLETMERCRPDLFFCESAWSGPESSRDAWRGRVYRNHSVLYENRRALLDILDYCGRRGIPTVFWNKEDPTFFGSRTYDFVDTALRFDHIFTTAAECVPRYRALGAKRAHTLMFGYSPALFSPEPALPRENAAVFAGSWYAGQPARCRDMERIFDMLLARGIALRIYDRQSDSSDPDRRFPEKYRAYVRPKVAYHELGAIFRAARYGVNINTVQDSDTMFARRVFEMMACGLIVVSNASRGMRDMFGDRVWFLDEPFDTEKEARCREENLRAVRAHTCAARLEEVLHTLRGG